MKFIVNDESVKNSHGFRVLNAGIDFSRFKDNPVMLLQHDQNRIIGRWKNWEIKGSQLIMECEFDEKDELALQTKGKVDRGFLKGTSMGIHITRMEYATEDENDLVATACEMCETSLASVPSNRGAICLYDGDMSVLSNNDIVTLCGKVAKCDNDKLNNKENNMEKMTLTVAALTALGLQQDATDVAISAAIVELQQRCNSAVTELQQHKESVATAMVDKAFNEGRITADTKEAFLSLAKTNFDLAKKTLDALPVPKSLSAQITNSGDNGKSKDNRDAWTYKDWAKKDPEGLAQLKLNDNAAFVALQMKR